MNNQLEGHHERHAQVEGSSSVYQPPPLPLKVFLAARGSSNDRQRALASSNAESESSGPYKPVPAPKPLPNPPPYRQPPQPLTNPPGSLPSADAELFGRFHPDESAESPPQTNEALLAYSSKFPTDKEVVVATSDKVAEVSRIHAATQGHDPRTNRHSANMNGSGVQSYPEGLPDDMRRPASYMPVHVHFSGWHPAETSNYIPMHYSATAENSTHQHNVGNNNPAEPLNDQPHSHYEIRIDEHNKHSAPGNVGLAWQNAPEAGDTSTFDRLRDACNKMFTREGNLRNSAHFPMSSQLPTRNGGEPAQLSEANVGIPTRDTDPQKPEEPKAEPETKNNTLGRKLAGKTYHSIKDIFKISSLKPSKAAEPPPQPKPPAAAPPAAPTRPADSVHAINQRIHSQLLTQQQQQGNSSVWGSYSRPQAPAQYPEPVNDPESRITLTPGHESASRLKPSGPQSLEMSVSSSEPDTSALARLNLNSRQESFSRQVKPGQGQGHTSPFLVRHPKPSVTFRMDLNECQYDPYSGGHNPSQGQGQGQSQGQVVLYDDTMHFPASLSNDAKKPYPDAVDSSWSSIQSPVGRSAFTYGDYDVPPSSKMNPYSGADGLSSGHQSAGSNSDVDKRSAQSGSTSDSGLGAPDALQRNRTMAYQRGLDTSTESDKVAQKNDWNAGQMNQSTENGRCNTPPLPPLSPENSPMPTPKLQRTYSASKPDLLEPASPAAQQNLMKSAASSSKLPYAGAAIHRSSSIGQSEVFKGVSSPALNTRGTRKPDEEKKAPKTQMFTKSRPTSSKSLGGVHSLSALQDALDLGEITSLTSTGLDLEVDSECSSSQSDGDFNTTAETTDSRALRKQLEGLESMYFEVLKTLNKKSGKTTSSGDYKMHKRRLYGSMSSLPSSVCSRPLYRDRKRSDDRIKRTRDKSSNKRFQRLESHVVTLARSVAHLSSEMRTQHMMIQELESIRNDIAQLKSTPLRLPGGASKFPRSHRDDFEAWQGTIPALTDPSRVKKLTSFFGDEPPLLRIFLKKLGYEKYAPLFEQEKIGMIELPYVTEERLQKMGIPMGPRIRILQEAQIAYRQDVNTFYVV